MSNIKYVDVCVGLAWGDEAKGKIVSCLSNQYDFVCRYNGGNNAGHTIYINGNRYVTHLIPSGIFHNVKSIIGPDCVVNKDDFFKEINYLKSNGFDTSLIKISPYAHIVTEEHINEDKNKHSKLLGTTSKGIGPCYRDKYQRSGKRICDYLDDFKDYIWDEKLYGKILCEGAQGFWLDINYGNYPYVTSSNTLPYSSCSLGFPPQFIRNIYGACKIYDTRSGLDTDFPESLIEDELLSQIIDKGEEYGATTGRKRKVNWLNLDKLIKAINISGTTHLVISKLDILQSLNLYKYFYENNLIELDSLEFMKKNILDILNEKCGLLKNIEFSDNKISIQIINN